MGLFDQIVGALNNPNQQGSPDQLSSILGAVQQLAGNRGIDPSTTQAVMSVVGGYVRSALQEKRNTGGTSQAEVILNQFGGTQPNAGALQALFSPAQQQQLAQAVAQKTGLDPSMVQAILPTVVPLVLNMLKTGTNTQSLPTGDAPNPNANSVLNAFLDADGDGDVDMGDTLMMANRYLNQR